jgi:hypothetical protein
LQCRLQRVVAAKPRNAVADRGALRHAVDQVLPGIGLRREGKDRDGGGNGGKAGEIHVRSSVLATRPWVKANAGRIWYRRLVREGLGTAWQDVHGA